MLFISFLCFPGGKPGKIIGTNKGFVRRAILIHRKVFYLIHVLIDSHEEVDRILIVVICIAFFPVRIILIEFEEIAMNSKIRKIRAIVNSDLLIPMQGIRHIEGSGIIIYFFVIDSVDLAIICNHIGRIYMDCRTTGTAIEDNSCLIDAGKRTVSIIPGEDHLHSSIQNLKDKNPVGQVGSF